MAGRKKKVEENLPEKYNNKIDLEEAFRLRYIKGLTLEEVGKVFNVSASAVQQRLGKFVKALPDPDQIQVFKDNMSNMLTGGMLKVFMSALEDGTIDNAKLWEKSNFFGMMFDKMRLLENKSTQNIAVKEITKEIEELEKAIKEYKDKKLNKDTGTATTDTNTERKP